MFKVICPACHMEGEILPFKWSMGNYGYKYVQVRRVFLGYNYVVYCRCGNMGHNYGMFDFEVFLTKQQAREYDEMMLKKSGLEHVRKP